jgi:hypothetical protein
MSPRGAQQHAQGDARTDAGGFLAVSKLCLMSKSCR